MFQLTLLLMKQTNKPIIQKEGEDNCPRLLFTVVQQLMWMLQDEIFSGMYGFACEAMGTSERVVL